MAYRVVISITASRLQRLAGCYDNLLSPSKGLWILQQDPAENRNWSKFQKTVCSGKKCATWISGEILHELPYQNADLRYMYYVSMYYKLKITLVCSLRKEAIQHNNALLLNILRQIWQIIGKVSSTNNSLFSIMIFGKVPLPFFGFALAFSKPPLLCRMQMFQIAALISKPPLLCRIQSRNLKPRYGARNRFQEPSLKFCSQAT